MRDLCKRDWWMRDLRMRDQWMRPVDDSELSDRQLPVSN